MPTTPRTSAAAPSPKDFRIRAITAVLAAAGLVGSLVLPAPVALAAEPEAEIYAQEAPIVLAQAGTPVALLNDPGSISVAAPMAQLKSNRGLELSVRPLGPASGSTAASQVLAAPKVLPSVSYCYIDLVVDLKKGVSFPPAIIGAEPVSRLVTVTNTSAQPKSLDGAITTTGEFSSLSNCTGTLAPGESCTIELAFSPQSGGTQTGELSVPVGGFEELLSVPLVGTASAYGPTPYVYPDCLDFGAAYVGQQSYTDYVEVYNYDYFDSGTPLEITSFNLNSPNFLISDNECVGPIAPYEWCNIYMFFRPTTVGPLEGTLSFRSNAEPGWELYPVTLLGYGLAAPAGTLTRSPDGLVFGLQEIGTTSAAQTIVVRNQSSIPTDGQTGELANAEAPITFGAPVKVKSVVATGDFAQTNDCGTIDPGASCRINVTFSPTAEGDRRGTVTVLSDATNPSLVTQLLGTGTKPAAAALQLSAYSASFGNAIMGRPGERLTITLKSIGGLALEIGSIYTTGDYSQTNNCPAVMPTGAECKIDIGFQPTIPGVRPGELVIVSNADPAVTEANLIGKGCRPFGPAGSRLSTPSCN
jgi:hypothetical protein